MKVRLTTGGFRSLPYLEAYARRTDALAELDAELAIGGLWNEMGKRQFDFLISEGLRPSHSLLDIGCGTLRGGRLFIDYLETGKYTGFDISEGVILKARQLLEQEGLEEKEPDIRVNPEKNLKFLDYRGQTFDFILAQSVFSHLMEEHIDEAFQHIGSVMHPESRFFFTFHIGPDYERRSNTDFQYPIAFFENLATKYGFKLTDRSSVYKHPRGQGMVCVSLEGK